MGKTDFRVILWLATVWVVVAACTPQVSAGPTRLQVVMADDWADTAAVLDAVRAFEREHSDVEVDVEGLPFAQIVDAVRAAAETDQPYDVAHWHAFAAGAQGLARPLDDVWRDSLDESSFVAGAVEDVTWGEHRYGIPLDVNAMILITNEDLLERHDVEEPLETFADVARAADAVTDAEGQVRGLAVAHSSWTTYGWIRAAGGEVVEVGPDGDPLFTLDTPANVRALQFLADLVRDGLAFPPVSRNVPADAFALFRSERAALHFSGSWDVAGLERAGVAWDHDIALMPAAADAAPTGTALGGSSLFVPVDSTQPELAVEFMRHLTSDEYALRYAREEGRLPARHGLYDEPFFDRPVYRIVHRQLDRATPMKLIAFPAADRIFSEAIEGVLTGRVDAGEALRDAQARVEDLGDDLEAVP